MSFTDLLNKSLIVSGLTDTGTTDGGGNPIYTEDAKGTVPGRIDHRVHPEEVNGPDLNPVISDYIAFTEIPSFEITERDSLSDDTGVYEILGVAPKEGRSTAHHLELTLRKVTA